MARTLWVGVMLVAAAGAMGEALRWEQEAPLPDAVGFAGPFAGASNGVLVVGGGANFPGGRPWDGHPKVFHDRIFILERPGGPWRVAERKLPRPIAYGTAITTEMGIACIGGADAERHYAEAFLMRWVNGGVEVEPLPALPMPLAYACGAAVGKTLYVAGGIDSPAATQAQRGLWSLDLSAEPAKRKWTALEPIPGAGRQLAVAAARGDSFFVFGGVALEKDEKGVARRVKPYLSDAYRYTQGTWRRIADLPHPVAAAPSPAPVIGPNVLLLSGDDGSLPGAAMKDAHPGFGRDILAYDTATNTYAKRGPLPQWPAVTTAAVMWNGRIVIPTGEVRPGVRTPRVIFARVEGP